MTEQCRAGADNVFLYVSQGLVDSEQRYWPYIYEKNKSSKKCLAIIKKDQVEARGLALDLLRRHLWPTFSQRVLGCWKFM